MWRGELRAVATARRAPSGCAQPCAVGEEVWLEGEPASKPGVGGHRRYAKPGAANCARNDGRGRADSCLAAARGGAELTNLCV